MDTWDACSGCPSPAPPAREARDALPPRHGKTATATAPASKDAISQATHLAGIRHARYAGISKVHLEHIFATVALNLIRLNAWWTGVPLQRARTTYLARLGLSLAA